LSIEKQETYAELELLLRQLSVWVKAEGRKVIKEGNYDITPSQFDVLQRIYFGETSMTNLALRLGVAKSTITGLVGKIKEHGYVSYSVCEEDHRVRKLEMTPKGLGLIRDVLERRVQFIRKLFSTIDPFLVEEFRKVLRIVNNTVQIQYQDKEETKE